MKIESTKIRVNFENKNMIDGVNMSRLANSIISLIDNETKIKLKNSEPKHYDTIIKQYFNK